MAMSEAEESAWVCRCFDELMASPDEDAWMRYLLAHPLLFSGQAHGQIQAARRDDPRTAKALAFLDQSRVEFFENPAAYPLGFGPLEQVAAALRAGSLDFDEALRKVREPGCADLLSRTCVHSALLAWLDELDKDVTYALQLAELALESSLAMSLPRIAPDVRRAAAEGYIRMVHGVLMRRPDGRAWARAMSIGKWAIEDANALGRPTLAGAHLHRLGLLALDAYQSKFDPSPEYPQEIAAWLAVAAEPMPTAEAGLGEAHRLLSAALPLMRPGSDLGNAFKALIQVEIYLACLTGRPVDADEVSSLARQALEQLDAAADAGLIREVMTLLENFDAK